MRALNWLIALCGIWEAGDIALPFVIGFGHVSIMVWSHIIAGVVLIFAGARGALANDAGTVSTMSWLAAAGGIWLVIAALIWGANAGRWNDVFVGILVLVLSLASQALARREGKG